jgi:hypothetical protein
MGTWTEFLTSTSLVSYVANSFQRFHYPTISGVTPTTQRPSILYLSQSELSLDPRNSCSSVVRIDAKARCSLRVWCSRISLHDVSGNLRRCSARSSRMNKLHILQRLGCRVVEFKGSPVFSESVGKVILKAQDICCLWTLWSRMSLTCIPPTLVANSFSKAGL